MKKILIVATTLMLATSAYAQTSGDNPGGRSVTSTGGPTGVTGKNPDGSMAKPSSTTGSGMTTGAGGNAAVQGNNGNSAQGSNAAPNIKGGNSGSGR